MSGTVETYLLDTNIFIYFFNGETAVRDIFDKLFSGEIVGAYCPLTWVELLCYPGLVEDEATAIRELLQSLERVELTPEILDRAAQIRQVHRTPLPDALIGACALERGYTLFTRNTKDFACVEGLVLVDPFAG
ncbi:MAG: type II toxin-antitoxin system VapC family toxin [Synechococcales cyanobacterium RM1_1_8]|nr:type II toxin-antitoxin system VapC family toxin [Synechococcales cyanobacterium RM1_1_8]